MKLGEAVLIEIRHNTVTGLKVYRYLWPVTPRTGGQDNGEEANRESQEESQGKGAAKAGRPAARVE